MLRCRGSFRIFLDGDLDLGLNGGLFDVIDLRGQVITGRPVSLRDAFSDICFLFYCTLLRLAKERRQDAARPTKRATSKAELFQKSRIRKNPMKEKLFQYVLLTIALAFTIFFFFYVIPPALSPFDPWSAILGGFVNPFASGYSTDVILCWVILAAWIIYDSDRVKHGWICILLGAVPGVAVGFALYLIMRMKQGVR